MLNAARWQDILSAEPVRIYRPAPDRLMGGSFAEMANTGEFEHP
jgi:hypothetical protein